MFRCINRGPPDPMYDLKKQADADTSSQKVDLGVGIYRNEDGVYHEPRCVIDAKTTLSKMSLGHDYEITTGNPRFLELAAKVIFGDDCKKLAAGEIASVQTISGTGAIHLAAQLISLSFNPTPAVYIGTPTWGNYKPMFEIAGLKVVEYKYYDTAHQTVDFDSVLEAVEQAPAGSVFILQGCCYNPTGADLTTAQWEDLATKIQEKGHLPLLDVAYQGLGNGLDQDAFSTRLFVRKGIETLICQSLSKNFSLYGERCGALHAVCDGKQTALTVHDRLRVLIRWEFSSSPAFGSRLVTIVLGDEQKKHQWEKELEVIRARIKRLRRILYFHFKSLKTPGNWDNIVKETGLFSFLPLSPEKCNFLVEKYHFYMPTNGRINVSGLNESNIEGVARSIDHVVRMA